MVDRALGTPRMDGRIETLWRGEDEEDGRGSWMPSFPEPARARCKDQRPEKAVRFEDSKTVLIRRSESEEESGSVDGSSAFI